MGFDNCIVDRELTVALFVPYGLAPVTSHNFYKWHQLPDQLTQALNSFLPNKKIQDKN